MKTFPASESVDDRQSRNSTGSKFQNLVLVFLDSGTLRLSIDKLVDDAAVRGAFSSFSSFSAERVNDDARTVGKLYHVCHVISLLDVDILPALGRTDDRLVKHRAEVFQTHRRTVRDDIGHVDGVQAPFGAILAREEVV